MMRVLARGWLIERARVRRLRVERDRLAGNLRRAVHKLRSKDKERDEAREDLMDAARSIATLIRERDEARTERDDFRSQLYRT